MEDNIYFFYKTSYPNEEVNRTEPSPSVSHPWHLARFPLLIDSNGDSWGQSDTTKKGKFLGHVRLEAWKEIFKPSLKLKK